MLSLIFTLTCGFYLLLAFIVALNARKVNIKANKWLALFLLSIGGIMLNTPFEVLKLFERYPHLIGFGNIFLLLIAPTLYLSILYFVNPTRIFQKKDYWHFFPTVFLLVLNIPFYLETREEKLADFKTKLDIYDKIAGTILIVIPFSIYWFLAYRKLTNHQRNVKLFASSIEAIDLSWLRKFLFGLAVFLLLIFNEILEIFPNIIQIAPILYAFSAFYLTYFIIKQEEIFPEKPQEILEIQTIIEENEQHSERKQLFTNQQFVALKEQLIHIMDNDKPYLQSTLNLPNLATMMQITTNELSYLINAGFEDNFYGFVNSYRVEESKSLLITPKYQHLSMIGIAFEAGFNSKTAFNTAFKKIVGVSPTEFQKMNQP
jgi:AraC-like DNA-binding protein